MRFMFLSIMFFFTFFIPIAFASDEFETFEGKWNGVEVMGCDYNTAKLVRKLIPIKAGTPFSFDEEKFKLWCETVKSKTNKNVNCTFVGYTEGAFYFNVDFLPSIKKKEFRNIPASSSHIKILPKRLNNLYDNWDKTFINFMNNGAVPKQFYKNGYLQCNNFELQKIAQELSNTAPKYNQVILNIIRYSQNPLERTKAATLLSWAKHPENVSIILKENLLNDPDIGVRNELARSFSYLINDVKDKSTLKASIDACCEQVVLPSHSDRTKALASLLLIFQLHPELNSSLNYQCKKTLLYINRMSILPNVGGTAKEILKIVENKNENINYR